MKPRARPLIRRLAWGACLVLAGAAQAAPARLELLPQTLSPAEAAASTALFDDALARLPPRWRAALHGPLTLQWTTRLAAGVQGHANGRRIRLDRRLLDAADATAARATLIHELAHLLDRGADGGLSRDPRLRDLAGWQQRAWWPGRGDNHFQDRSPDRYELASPAEFVAVNLEHFVLDADYRCRRPALYAWFAERLGAPALAPSACTATLPFMQADDEDGAVSLLQLDPARVWAVDYLLAEGNDQPMSHWGHSMLRLVICAPGRTPGPACRLDLRYHRVISFRAFVGDLQLSSWRGLTGRYPSRLFLLPLDQVVDDYTKVELRALSSIPLALSRAEIAALLERAAAVHWGYDGRYFFLGNNCATETWKLLHDALPRLAALPLGTITPTGLQARLARNGVADRSVLDDHAQALRQGYYFASAAEHYQAMFEVVRATLAVPQRDVAAWLDSRPEQRRGWMALADLRTSAALLLLEEAASRREELQVRETVKRRLLHERSAEAAQGRDDVLAALSEAGVLSRPAALLDGEPGYGLPQAAERAHAAAEAARRSQQLRGEWSALRQRTRAGLPAQQRATLAAIDDNLRFLGTRLRQLNAEDGAVPLLR